MKSRLLQVACVSAATALSLSLLTVSAMAQGLVPSVDVPPISARIPVPGNVSGGYPPCDANFHEPCSFVPLTYADAPGLNIAGYDPDTDPGDPTDLTTDPTGDATGTLDNIATTPTSAVTSLVTDPPAPPDPSTDSLTTNYAQAATTGVAQRPAPKQAAARQYYLGWFTRLLVELEHHAITPVPGTTTVAAAQWEMINALRALEGLSYVGAGSSKASTNATARPSSVHFAPVRDPREFPVIGHPGHKAINRWDGISYWIAYIRGRVGSNGDVEIYTSDKVASQPVVFPQANTSSVSWGYTYFPQSSPTPYYSNIHLQLWVLCYKTLSICGSDNYSWTGTVYITSSFPMNGHDISIATKLWGKELDSNNYNAANARTGSALCNRTNDRCRYLFGGKAV